MNFSGIVKSALAATVLLALALPPAHAADPIKIGFSMEETGGLAANGKPALLAFQIWAEDINAKGGLLGRHVELVHYDDQSSPANVPGIYTKLLDVDKVDLVVSSYATGLIAPAMPIVMQHNKVFLGLLGLGVNAQFQYPEIFLDAARGAESEDRFHDRLLQHRDGAEAEAEDDRHRLGRYRIRA